MRILVAFVVGAALASYTYPAFGANPNLNRPDPQAIAALEIRAQQAAPREQCFLYAQLVQQMTELSLQQYAAGNVEQASQLLQRIQLTAEKLHQALAQRDKRLKDAEILLRRTAFRLGEMLHSSSYEDRPLVQETLTRINRAQAETMMQVFSSR